MCPYLFFEDGEWPKIQNFSALGHTPIYKVGIGGMMKESIELCAPPLIKCGVTERMADVGGHVDHFHTEIVR